MDPDQTYEQSDQHYNNVCLCHISYVVKLFWRKSDKSLLLILQIVWTQIRLLRSSLIRVHSVILHEKICFGENLK